MSVRMTVERRSRDCGTDRNTLIFDWISGGDCTRQRRDLLTTNVTAVRRQRNAV